MLTIADLQKAQRSMRIKPIACPHCDAQLNAHFRTVIATRNCPRCGKRVLAEPEDTSHPPPFTAEQLTVARISCARAMSRASWLLLASILILLVGTFTVVLNQDIIRDAVSPVMDLGYFKLIVVLGPVGILCLVAMVLLYRSTHPSVKCPHCDSPCVAACEAAINLTQLTGNCVHCGKQLINVSPPDAVSESIPTVDEFRSVAWEGVREDWRGLLLIAVGLVLPLTLILIQNPDQLWATFEKRYGPMTTAIIWSAIFGGVALGMLGAAAVGLLWLTRRRQRKWKAYPILNCPHCQAQLFPVHQVIASQRCPSCGKWVLAKPDARPVGVADESATG